MFLNYLLYFDQLPRLFSHKQATVPSPAAVVICALAAITLVGCAWSQPPSSAGAILAPYTVTGATAKVEAGRLFLTREGLWAYVPAETEYAPDFKTGEIVGFLPSQNRATAHLYGVVLTRSWGVLLQRLDSQPVVASDVRGKLLPIYGRAQFRRWGLCAGSGPDIAANKCVQAAGRDAKWRIFGSDEAQKLSVPAPDSWGSALPIRTAGLLIDGRSIMPEKVRHDHWIAVPAHQPRRAIPQNRPALAHARVAIDASCPEVDLSQSLQPIEVFQARIERPADPMATEAAAIRTGADVLLRCDNGAIRVDVPVLYRPLFSVGNTAAQGIPYGAMRPLPVPGGDSAESRTAALQATVLLGAALGTGSTLAADFYLEEALRAAPDSQKSRDLALGLMQVFAAAGRPEIALRAGRRAVQGAWHIENNPSFVLGRSWARAALGKKRAYSKAVSRISKLAEMPENAQLRLWLAWNAIRADATKTGGRSVRSALSYLEEAGLTRWLEAANLVVDPALRIKTAAEPGADSNPSITELGRVFAPRTTGAKEKSCADDAPCRLDVYGRNFARRLDEARADADGDLLRRLLRDLGTISVAVLRPGFDLQTTDFQGFSASAEVGLRAALMPLLKPVERAREFDALIAAASRAVRDAGNCATIPGAKIVAARLDGEAPILRATRWLVGDAFDAACSSPADFAASLERSLGPHETLARRAIPLLLALSENADSTGRAEMLRHVADFSSRHQTGAACTRFNLALALSNAKAGMLKAAAARLSKSVNCSDAGAEKYEASKQLINAYLRFEKSARVPDGISEATRQSLLKVIRRAPAATPDSICFALAPLDYQLQKFVHPDIAALAVALPKPEPDALVLETSSRSLARGLAALKVARRFIAEARPNPAAAALLDARAAFARIGHQVGLQRVAFLEKVVFSGDLKAFRDAEDSDDSTDTKAEQQTPSAINEAERIPLDSPESLSIKDWSRALQQGQADEILAIFNSADPPDTANATRAYTAAVLLSGLDAPKSALESLCK
jgi:hypothetical protein